MDHNQLVSSLNTQSAVYTMHICLILRCHGYGFMLRGEPFANGSSVSLEDIGETAEALIFQQKLRIAAECKGSDNVTIPTVSN